MGWNTAYFPKLAEKKWLKKGLEAPLALGMGTLSLCLCLILSLSVCVCLCLSLCLSHAYPSPPSLPPSSPLPSPSPTPPPAAIYSQRGGGRMWQCRHSLLRSEDFAGVSLSTT